ncbi:Drug/metabolite transporter [Cynara cardunculus var. scolymus]|uniref:WAT1-related protein n=1 Tax=Cynara cardunculus var. scolymus TaxID=59895 RepID=A0A118JW77_CYNCS|nr:Drug/metabolite transporter [Cynara cardunculus var. scolymus]
MDGKGYGKWYPVLVMIAVHFAFATINVLLKKVIDDGLNHLVFITYRLTVATIFLAPVAFFFESGRAKVIGTLVCVGGATLLTLYKGVPLFNHHSHLQDTINVQDISRLSSVLTSRKARWTSGSLALIAGSILWSSWFLVQSNIGKRYPLQYSSTAIMMFFGAIQSFVLSMSLERDISSWILKGKLEIFSVFYAGIIGSGFCFVAMSWCVKKRGPVFCAAFSPLVQMIAALFDIPFLHEPLHLGSLVGSAIVVIGLYILLWGKNKELQTSGVAKGDPDNEKAKVQDPESQVTCDSKDPPTPES